MPPLSSIQMEPDRSNVASSFVKSQLFHKIKLPPTSTNLSGRVALVTGGASGLGLHCCRQLLELKLSHLIITVRSPRKGEDAKAKLLQEFPDAKIEVWELEMGSYQSVQALARHADQLNRLDIAILNAGLVKAEFELNTSTGHEETIQINYLSMALLAILLLPVLKNKSPAGSPGRLTIVSSGTAYFAAFHNRNEVPLLASFDKQPTSGKKALDPETYWVSKLLGHLFLVKLANYVRAEDVVVNLVEPGLCKGSQLNRESGGVVALVMWIMKSILGRSLDVGASTYVDAAVVKGKETHGSYLADWEIKPLVLAPLWSTPSAED
jgi:NAD(P)-dependent dehydrogenase (short-subunit alcohol dehydrogenase family)